VRVCGGTSFSVWVRCGNTSRNRNRNRSWVLTWVLKAGVGKETGVAVISIPIWDDACQRGSRTRKKFGGANKVLRQSTPGEPGLEDAEPGGTNIGNLRDTWGPTPREHGTQTQGRGRRKREVVGLVYWRGTRKIEWLRLYGTEKTERQNKHKGQIGRIVQKRVSAERVQGKRLRFFDFVQRLRMTG